MNFNEFQVGPLRSPAVHSADSERESIMLRTITATTTITRMIPYHFQIFPKDTILFVPSISPQAVSGTQGSSCDPRDAWPYNSYPKLKKSSKSADCTKLTKLSHRSSASMFISIDN